MEILLTSIHVIAAFVLITVVLLQHGKGADIGATFGGGSSQTVFGSRGAGNFLTKMTTIFVVLFMGTSISLTYLSTPQSVFDDLEVPAQAPAGESSPDATPIGEGEDSDPTAIPGFEAVPAPEEDPSAEPPDEQGSAPAGGAAAPSGTTSEPSQDAAPEPGTAPSPATPQATEEPPLEDSSESTAPAAEPSAPAAGSDSN